MEQTKQKMIAANREYRITHEVAAGIDVYRVHYQPINPKTGKPWQSYRTLSHNHDTALSVKHSEVDPNNCWLKYARNCWTTHSGYSTMDKAVDAIAKHARKAR